MTQEEKAKAYDEALERARKLYNDAKANEYISDIDDYEYIFPSLAESEDERIRKRLIEYFEGFRMGNAEVKWEGLNVQEVLVWLEKQKEQKPVEPSDDELQRYQDELYNFKVFAAKQAKEHHISFVHDFEWNNFCAELLSYFNEKQKPAEVDERMKNDKHFLSICQHLETLISESKNDEAKESIDKDYRWLCEFYRKSLSASVEENHKKPAEWSEEDKEMLGKVLECIRFAEDRYQLEQEETNGVSVKLWLLDHIIPQQKPEWSEEDEKKIIFLERLIEHNVPDGQYGWVDGMKGGFVTKSEAISMLKSLRPSWKPSEEQMDVDIREEIKKLEFMGSNDARDILHVAEHFYELGLKAK